MNRKRRNAQSPTPEELALTVELFATLANPLRLAILCALAEKGSMSAGDLQTAVGAEQSAVSHQLATLRKRRLVASEPDGRRRLYRMVDDHVAHIVRDAVIHATEAARD